MDNIKNEVNKIREKLIDHSITTLMILAIPAVAFLVMNVIKFGWHPNYILHLIEFIIVSLLFLFHKKIPTIFKAHILASFFILAGFLGNLFFSLSGGHFLCLIGIALITLFYGKKNGIIYSLISFFGYILIAVLNNYGIIERNIDFNQFNNSFNAWIIAIFVLTLIAIILIISISYFYNYFISLITELNKKNNEMAILNKDYQIALKKIEDSEIKYKSIFQTLEEGIVITDDKGKIIDCNSASENLLGANKEVLLNINILEQDWGFIRPDFSIMPFEECPGKISFHKGIHVSKVELGLIKEDGVKWFIVSSAPLGIEGYGVFNTFTDITNRKKEEEKNATFNRNFEAFLDHITDFLYFKDINRRIIFCSQSLADITGYKNWRDIIGKHDFEIFPQDTAEIYNKEDKIVFEGGKQLLGTIDLFYYKTGERGYVQTNKWPLFDEKNNVVGVLGISRDITEQRKEREELKEREEKISLLLNSTAEGIYGIDLNGNCTFANKSCVDILGFDSPENLIGKNMHNLIHHSYLDNTPMNIENCKVNIAVKDGYGTHVDDEVYWRMDNTCFPVEYYSYPQIKNGKTIGAVITFMDITQKKEAEDKLRLYSKELNELNSDKDKFIKILAHDLRSPFTSLIGFSDFILNNIEELDIETIKSQIEIINQTSNTTFNMLEDILIWLNNLSGKLKIEPTNFYLKEVCDKITPPLRIDANSKNIEIKCSNVKDISIFADKNMIMTILRNLISNAIKFTNTNGEINVALEITDREIMISVSDNGVGISEDALKTIWINSYNNKTIGTSGEKGTGLGLTICKEFVEKHGGKIWVESQVGVGSNFKFTIPLNK